jgi:LysM repeat protein
MTRRNRYDFHVRRAACVACAGAVLASVLAVGPASAVTWPVTPQQRGTAQQVAQAGVPLSELAPNAPDQYTVKRRDTLWDISKIFLKSPWRWPELWGMNLDQIRNPHLIYPGQVLFLDKSGGRARLRVGQGPSGTVKLSPRVRSDGLDANPIASIPFHLIEPFLNEAVIFQGNELESAPRIVAAPEGRVLMGRGDLAYVRGDLSTPQREYRVFREPKPLLDPTTNEVLGYEANYVGTAEYTRQGETASTADGKSAIIPATFLLTNLKQEAGVGDRLAAVPPPQFSNYTPHAPQGAMAGQIVSVYGEGLNAGQNQIVSLNRGTRDGMERGHVLALWRAGAETIDKTDPARPTIRLPDERHGTLFVFRVFDRMSYALIMSVQEPVKRGDRFTEP